MSYLAAAPAHAPGRSADAVSGSADRPDTTGVRVAFPHVDDLPLFMPAPLARHSDPATSHAAARRVHAQAQRRILLRTLLSYWPLAGATNDELDATLGWRVGTASRRMTELCRAGLAERLATTRPTRTGADAFIHTLTSYGRATARALGAADQTETPSHD